MRSTRRGGSIVAVTVLVSLGADAALAQPDARLGKNFSGGGQGINSGFVPPDSMGTVGDDHVVQLINGDFSIWRKASGRLVERKNPSQFWRQAGAEFSGGRTFDPRITYDPFRERFYAAALDNSRGAGNDYLIGASETSDPRGDWNGFRVEPSDGDIRSADFPQLGYDRDHVYVASNMFDQGERDLEDGFSVNAAVVKKDELLNPGGDGISPDIVTEIDDITGSFSQPTVDRDNSGERASLFARTRQSPIDVAQFATGSIGPGRSPLDPSANEQTIVEDRDDPQIGPINAPPSGDQPGNVSPLTSVVRIGTAVKRVNGSFWGVQGVEDPATGNAGVRWFRVDADSNELQGSGIIADDELDFIYPSIAVNDDNQIVIGVTGTSEQQFPSSFAVTGELNDDGEVTFSDEILLEQGLSSFGDDEGETNRWGDYSATKVDPSDPQSFWTFQEIAGPRGQWRTQITQVIVPEPASALGLISGLLALSVGHRPRRRTR